MKRITKIKKSIKKNLTSLILFMLFLIMVLVVIFVFSVFVPATSSNAYGNRLDGIEEYVITEERLTSLSGLLKGEEIVSDGYVRVSGKIVYINMALSEEVTIDDGKALAQTYMENFESEETEFYDFQVFITDASEDENVSIGYKAPSSETFSWTNN